MEHFFSWNSGEDQKKGFHQKWNQTRSQKFAMGGTNFWDWGHSLQPQEARESGAELPALENFAFFCKNSLILGLF